MSYAAVAAAADLEAFNVEDHAKKVVVTYTLTDPVEAEVVSHFANNFVGLNLPGVKFSSKQTRKDHYTPGVDDRFFRYLKFINQDGFAQARVYLGSLATPADAQLLYDGNKLIVEIIKPLWKLPEGETAAVAEEAGGEPAEPPAVAVPEQETPPAEAAGEPSEGGFRTEATPGEVVPEEAIVPDLPELPTHPPYTLFDLDQVPVSKLEIRGTPFDEAILALVADSGFNVVVGDGIDDTEVNLSFTQRDTSLKKALDSLCIAYDLVYHVEADAIIIKAK